jgi:hypothetical protein
MFTRTTTTATMMAMETDNFIDSGNQRCSDGGEAMTAAAGER